MIVGFPGETAEDFELTLDLVRRVRFHSMFSFKYSPRPNTLAIKRMPDDVTEEEKTRRILALQALQRDVQTEWHEQMVGTPSRCSSIRVPGGAPGSWPAGPRGNTIVNFAGPSELIGRLVTVHVTAAGPNSVRGEIRGE